MKVRQPEDDIIAIKAAKINSFSLKLNELTRKINNLKAQQIEIAEFQTDDIIEDLKKEIIELKNQLDIDLYLQPDTHDFKAKIRLLDESLNNIVDKLYHKHVPSARSDLIHPEKVDIYNQIAQEYFKLKITRSKGIELAEKILSGISYNELIKNSDNLLILQASGAADESSFKDMLREIHQKVKIIEKQYNIVSKELGNLKDLMTSNLLRTMEIHNTINQLTAIPLITNYKFYAGNKSGLILLDMEELQQHKNEIKLIEADFYCVRCERFSTYELFKEEKGNLWNRIKKICKSVLNIALYSLGIFYILNNIVQIFNIFSHQFDLTDIPNPISVRNVVENIMEVNEKFNELEKVYDSISNPENNERFIESIKDSFRSTIDDMVEELKITKLDPHLQLKLTFSALRAKILSIIPKNKITEDDFKDFINKAVGYKMQRDILGFFTHFRCPRS